MEGTITGTGRMMIFAFPLFLAVEYFCHRIPFDELFGRAPRLVRWAFYYLILIMILFLGVLDSAPEFIYFQF
jgi:hypothetical protein